MKQLIKQLEKINQAEACDTTAHKWANTINDFFAAKYGGQTGLNYKSTEADNLDFLKNYNSAKSIAKTLLDIYTTNDVAKTVEGIIQKEAEMFGCKQINENLKNYLINGIKEIKENEQAFNGCLEGMLKDELSMNPLMMTLAIDQHYTWADSVKTAEKYGKDSVEKRVGKGQWVAYTQLEAKELNKDNEIIAHVLRTALNEE